MSRVAAGGNLLAAATHLGRVYLIGPGEKWSEWIVGPVTDLVYFEGRIYALTSMATVALLDGESIEHLPLDRRESRLLSFKILDGLYFNTDSSVYRIEGTQLTRHFQISDEILDGRMLHTLELVSPQEGFVVAWDRNGFGVGLQRIEFDPLRVYDMSPIP